LDKALYDSYKGTGEPGAVRDPTAAHRAWAKDIRAVANRTEKPELKSGLADMAEYLDRHLDQPTADPTASEIGER